MIDAPRTDRYQFNLGRFPAGDDQYPCAVCGKPLRRHKVRFWVCVLDDRVLSRLESWRTPRDYVTWEAVGADCLRRTPVLRDYVSTVRPT